MAKKKRANYLKADELARLAVGDAVRTWEHVRRPDGHVEVVKGSEVTVGAVVAMNGAVIVEDRWGDVIGSTFSKTKKLERI